MGVDGKIQALNTAIKNVIPEMQAVAEENPAANLLVRAIKFSDGAQWVISQPTPVKDFKWVDLTAKGGRDMGEALTLVAEQLAMPPMTERALPPVLVLISDGQPTDNFAGGLRALTDLPWGKKAVRIAIAIGGDADLTVLQEFVGNSKIRPLQASNIESVINYIKWVSTAVLKSASSLDVNDVPRQKLIEIVTHRQTVTARTGRDVLSDAKLCEALLRDLCGEHKREIFVLVAALKERVAADLLASQNGVPRELLLSRLTRRLQDNLGLTEESARWAVDSWALALGVLAPGDLGTSHVLQASSPLAVTPPPVPPVIGPSRATAPARQSLTLTLVPGVTMDFVRVPAGEFLMGAADTDLAANSDEKPQHKVYLDEYCIGVAPVTVAQFAAFVQATKHQFQVGLDVKNKAHHPVTGVTWDEAVAFCAWVARQTGQKVRLPMEAEWEKAARGTDSRIYPWGDTEPTERLCNFNSNINDTTPVGQYSPQGDSPFGCADMAGNIWEWCADWFDGSYYTKEPSKNPIGPTSGQFRVLRGGSRSYGVSIVRASYRFRDYPNSRVYITGLRCAC